MASIQKRPDGSWRARYRDAANKEHARHFKRKVDAQRWLDGVTTAVVTGAYVDPKRSRQTVGATAAQWMANNPGWTESTRARNASIVNRHVLPRWGEVRLDRVRFEDVQQWVSDLSGMGLAPRTVRKVTGVLSSILTYAVTADRLKSNPAAKVKLPKDPVTRRRYLSAGQVEVLANAADDNGIVVYVLAYCGLRFGELAALRKVDVDMKRRRLRVERSVTEVNGRLVWGAPKDSQRRTVPFPSFLTTPLSERLVGLGDDDLVFQSARGEVLRVRNMRRDWFDGAVDDTDLDGLTPHELRHTAASMAVSAGANVLALQRMLGHEKPSVTLDVYADLFDDDLDAVAESMDSARADALADFLRTRDADLARLSDATSL